ncbi:MULTISPECIES: DUF721 domain-containing protein [Fervidobacterium]|uniref:DUF721 domain-containing protein n=1 Tax=Fervidobacterium nodosum (strain ATCC 35602 / DSM 5306 / Rt17-B1) TaxID=381764 RepID=A7HLN4_FERNB|nr:MULTISPECIES: DUF721 domain-containing protein [Fervidobacterium]ABS60817.1 hypothetical protein Fnod_0967 [Fervidobacterium nodosum Rt17-B1]KAF2962020.1 hypothetical protein AS161_06150 [Fervidobacterium sp. 2310opik-2]PHJ14325.1 hypothetical protein IM41_01445 [Fervidobacterium sp. SC_NGM5_G05]
MLTLKNAIKELSRTNSFFQKVYFLSILSEKSQEIFGQIIAKHIKFIEYKEGTLSIECDDCIWASEIRKMSRQIKKRIYNIVQIKVDKIIVSC